jgi:hypothetical protein
LKKGQASALTATPICPHDFYPQKFWCLCALAVQTSPSLT